MSLVDQIQGKSVEEVVDLLSKAYEEKQASLVKSALDENLKRSLIGAAIGAGVGGAGMAGSNLIKGKKLSIKDLLYGALLGSVPGASIGYLTGRSPTAGLAQVVSDAQTAPAGTSISSDPTAQLKNEFKNLSADYANYKTTPESEQRLADLTKTLNIPQEQVTSLRTNPYPKYRVSAEMTEAARAADAAAKAVKPPTSQLPLDRETVMEAIRSQPNLPPITPSPIDQAIINNPSLGRFASDPLAPYRR